MTELYTRCPHCHTVFKLHTAQLDAAGGKVRCGACLHVFVAKEHLVRPKQPVAPATPKPPAINTSTPPQPKPVNNPEPMPPQASVTQNQPIAKPELFATRSAPAETITPEIAGSPSKSTKTEEKAARAEAAKIENAIKPVVTPRPSTPSITPAPTNTAKNEPVTAIPTSVMAEPESHDLNLTPATTAESASQTSAPKPTPIAEVDNTASNKIGAAINSDFDNPFAAFEQFDLLTPIGGESGAQPKRSEKSTEPSTDLKAQESAQIPEYFLHHKDEEPIPDTLAKTETSVQAPHIKTVTKEDPFAAFDTFDAPPAKTSAGSVSEPLAKRIAANAPESSEMASPTSSPEHFEITNLPKPTSFDVEPAEETNFSYPRSTTPPSHMVKMPLADTAVENDWDQLKPPKKDRVEPVFDDNNGLELEDIENAEENTATSSDTALNRDEWQSDHRHSKVKSTSEFPFDAEDTKAAFDEMQEVHLERSPFALERKPTSFNKPSVPSSGAESTQRFSEKVDITEEIIIPEPLINEAHRAITNDEASSPTVSASNAPGPSESDALHVDFSVPNDLDIDVVDVDASSPTAIDMDLRVMALVEEDASDAHLLSSEDSSIVGIDDVLAPDAEVIALHDDATPEPDFSEQEVPGAVGLAESDSDILERPTKQGESDWGKQALKDNVLSKPSNLQKKPEISAAAKDVDFGETDDNWIMPSAKLQTVDIANPIKPKPTPAKAPQRFSAKNEGELAIERDWHIEALEAHGFDSDLLQEPKPRSYKGLMWAALALLLMSGLAAQYFWSHRVQLREDPQWSATVESVCQYVECSLPPRQDLSKIQLKQKSVIKERDDPSKLKIDLLIINNASFDQFYPDLLVRFTNIEGKIVAEDRFAPKEYLRELPEDHMMPAGIPVHVSFMVKSPSTTVTGYEFQFLPSAAKP